MTATPERPPIAQAPLSAVLLAYNSGPDLEEVLSAWDAYLISLARPYEIVVVNDASTDGTGPCADKLAAALPHLRVLHHDTHLGFGAALRTGLQNARNPLVFTVPCDKQFHPPISTAYSNLSTKWIWSQVTASACPCPQGCASWTVCAAWSPAFSWARCSSHGTRGPVRGPRAVTGWHAGSSASVSRIPNARSAFIAGRFSSNCRSNVKLQPPSLKSWPRQTTSNASWRKSLSAGPAHMPAVDAVEQQAGQELRQLFFTPEFGPGQSSSQQASS